MRPVLHFLMTLCLLIVMVGGAGCTGRRPPVKVQPGSAQALNRPATHRVQRGETLYAIATRYGINFRQLAQWNKISPPYTIYPSQTLHLRATAATQAKSPTQPVKQKKAPAQVSAQSASKKVATPSSSARKVAQSPSRTTAKPSPAPAIRWIWPTEGRVVMKFDASDPTKNGIEIEGKARQDIRAAAAGEVVYSGSGLVGYGNLVIVKHNELFLTAYGYNAELLVKEGDRVKSGSVIAKMGQGLNRRPLLHFEVRREGKPVNPLLYLPKK